MKKTQMLRLLFKSRALKHQEIALNGDVFHMVNVCDHWVVSPVSVSTRIYRFVHFP